MSTANYFDAWNKQMKAFYDALPTNNLHTRYRGAWDANDVDTAREVCRALKRRGEPVPYKWGND